MKPAIVLILGMVRRGEFESLQKRGLTLGIVVDTNNRQRLADTSQFAFVERFDFSRPFAELVELVRGIRRHYQLLCLYNVNELYVAPTADLAAALDMPGVAPTAARVCLDKNMMRRRFQERIGPESSARFQPIGSEHELFDFAEAVGYPVFLQPTNVSASMWATRNNTPEMLGNNYRAMLAEVPQHYRDLGQTSQRLGVVAAEYLEGRNTSIDCLVDHVGRVYTTPVVDVLTGQDVGIDDFHHFARILPNALSADEEHDLARLADAGVRSLDLTSCATHVEFIGRRLGEIAARPGGNRPRILELAYGMDVLYGYYQVLRGGAPDLAVTGHRHAAAIVTPFPRRNGILHAIRHLDLIPSLPGYLYHEVRGKAGQRVGLARGGFRAPLYIELRSDDADIVRRSIETIAGWSDLYEVE